MEEIKLKVENPKFNFNQLPQSPNAEKLLDKMNPLNKVKEELKARGLSDREATISQQQIEEEQADKGRALYKKIVGLFHRIQSQW